jgi:hypothetical protein
MSKPGRKRLPELPKPYHTAVMAEIEQQTDRGAAIVGGAHVDIVLREAISARVGAPDDIDKLLLENSGPLQDFGARIQIAFAIGIYGRAAYNDLRIIKDVRNVFAHSADAIDFSHSYVAERCKDFWFARNIPFPGKPTPSTAREVFIRTIKLLTILLHDNLGRQKDGLPLTEFLMMEAPQAGKAPSKASRPAD